jgi:hypothetical protein
VGTEPFLTEVAQVIKGDAKPLSMSPSYKKDIASLSDEPRMFGYAPASAVKLVADRPNGQAIVDGFLKDPGPFLMGVYTNEPGILMTIEGGAGGDKVPQVQVPAAPKLDIGSKLPAETVGYVAYSTKLDMKGSEAWDKLVEVLESVDESAAADFEKEHAALKAKLGAGLADLVDALGDQGVVAFIPPSGDLGIDRFEKLDPMKDGAVVLLNAVADAAKMKKIVAGARKASELDTSFIVTPAGDGGFDAASKEEGGPFVAVRYPEDHLFVGIGAEPLVKRALEAVEKGTNTLGSDKAHALGLSGIEGQPHVLSWFDVSRTLRPLLRDPALAAVGDLSEHLVLTGDDRLTMTTALGLKAEGKGYRYRLDMLNSMGVLPAVAIYGVRRYLASSKASEAKNTVGAIARGAAAAYEREHASGETHQLCKSAAPVPSFVPAAKKYQPKVTEGEDFETGDETTGWKCLKFAMTMPHYYQYGYTQGGPYKGPEVGGPDPGKDGFEAWAVGDLDGDGVTSLFTVTGTIDEATGNLKLNTQIFVHNEHE